MSAPESNSQPQVQFSATQTITVPEGVRVAARVKWFDNTMNYGFATVLEGEHTGKDIFVHQSNILTLGQNVYRTLRAGEYIEFELEETQGNEHKHQAVHVTGPRACPLMCETNPQRRRENGQGRGAPFGFVSSAAQGYGRGGFVPRGDSQSGFVPRGDSQSGFVPRGRGRGRGAGRRPVETTN